MILLNGNEFIFMHWKLDLKKQTVYNWDKI
jgi:hypothetical protein